MPVEERCGSRAALPRETFRIKARYDAPDYFIVHMADTLTALRAAIRAFDGRPAVDTLACCVGCQGSGDHAALIGVVFFARAWIALPVVAHELTHAAMRASERFAIDPSEHGTDYVSASAGEELFCQIVEHLNGDFWRECRRLGYA